MGMAWKVRETKRARGRGQEVAGLEGRTTEKPDLTNTDNSGRVLTKWCWQGCFLKLEAGRRLLP